MNPVLQEIAGRMKARCLFSYDCEFMDTGAGVKLISIGLVREDGAELYFENSAFAPDGAEHDGLMADEWMAENVWARTLMAQGIGDDRVRRLGDMREDLHRFLTEDGRQPSLWAHYAAYDYVGLCSIWGRMLDLPGGLPFHTMDFRQLTDLTGIKAPSQAITNHHNALVDARWGKLSFEAFGISFDRFDPAKDFDLPILRAAAPDLSI